MAPLSPQSSRGSSFENSHPLSNTFSASGPGTTDPTDLPIRALNDTARLDEFTAETADGQIVKPVKSNATGKIDDYKLVTFTVNDPENPKNWSKGFKWYCTMVVAFTCFVVAFCSSIITPGVGEVQEELGVSQEVALLTVTVFVIGFGVGMYSKRILYLNATFLLTQSSTVQGPWRSHLCLKCLVASPSTFQPFSLPLYS